METTKQGDTVTALEAEVARLRARLDEIEPWWEQHQAKQAGRRLTQQIRRETEDMGERAQRLIEARGQGHLVSRPNWEELTALLVMAESQGSVRPMKLAEQFISSTPIPGQAAGYRPPRTEGQPRQGQSVAGLQQQLWEELTRGKHLSKGDRKQLRELVESLDESDLSVMGMLPLTGSAGVGHSGETGDLAATGDEGKESIESAVSRQHKRQLERAAAKRAHRHRR